MAYWFYYTADGQKQGAVSEEKLKELAANGKITPGTMLEHQSGDTTVAKDVKWLTFGEAIDLQKSAPPPPVVTQPVPDENAKKVTKSIGEQMQDVGQGVQAIGKGACSCGCLVAILFVIFAAIFGTPSEEREQRKEEREQRRIEQKEQQDQRKAQQEQQKTERQSMPKMPPYFILSDDEFGIGNKNREVVVRLGVIATESELAEIANKIKRGKWKSYERTNVHFYLPGMVTGEGAWATGNFNPNLKVSIFGASEEILAHAQEGTYDLEAEKAAVKILENGIRDIYRALPTIPQAQLAASAKKIAQQEGDVSKVLYKLRNIANLAVATKTDLATTHRIVDNIMDTFGHGIEDSQKIVDILAATTVKGNMTLKELGKEFAESGEKAVKMGLDVAHTCTLIVMAKGAK